MLIRIHCQFAQVSPHPLASTNDQYRAFDLLAYHQVALISLVTKHRHHQMISFMCMLEKLMLKCRFFRGCEQRVP